MSDPPGVGRVPWVWGQLEVEQDRVVVRLSGWRRVLATKTTMSFPLASIARVEHDPMARSHVRSGLRNWRKHGQGIWRLGIYHGIDGWSFWSIGVGRNAVLIECSGEHFRYVVVEVGDPARTVKEDPRGGCPRDRADPRRARGGTTAVTRTGSRSGSARAGRHLDHGRMRTWEAIVSTTDHI